MGNNNTGGLGLDTYAYIGIAVDVVLAIIAGILVVWWRKRVKERYERRFKASNLGSETRTDLATDGSITPKGLLEGGKRDPSAAPFSRITVKSTKSGFTETTDIDPDVEENFAFLNAEMPPSGSPSTASGHVSTSQLGHAVVMDPTGSHTQGATGEQVIVNPLVVRTSIDNTPADDDENIPTNNADIAVTTYYTYPSDNWDSGRETGTGSEINRPQRMSLSGNEADQESDTESEDIVMPPPPPPPPTSVTPHYVDVEDENMYNSLDEKPKSAPSTEYHKLKDVRWANEVGDPFDDYESDEMSSPRSNQAETGEREDVDSDKAKSLPSYDNPEYTAIL